MLPTGSRLAAGSPPDGASSSGLIEVPRLAPSTRAKAACKGIAPFAANDMTSSTTATLEWAAQVRTAASKAAISGSVVIESSSSRRMGVSSGGVTTIISSRSAKSMSPRPMPTRLRSRVREARPRRNSNRSMSTRIGAARYTSKARAWTIKVVPTLAPSITASAGTGLTRPPAVNDVTVSAVAVLLCNPAVTTRPTANALIRLPSAMPSRRRKLGPNARWIPLWTICKPQSSSATNPARLTRASDWFIVAASLRAAAASTSTAARS